MNKGYINLWRKLSETSFYRDSYAVHLAIHCIMRANHKDTKITFRGQEMLVSRGSFISGRYSLATETGITPSTIRNKLSLLLMCHFLDIRSTNRFSVITVCNYDSYQNTKPQLGQQLGQPEDSQRTARGHRQECKEVKNEKNSSTSMEYLERWNSRMPWKVQKLSSKRREHLQARLREKDFVDNFDLLLTKILGSRFLSGKAAPRNPGEKPFRADFDWIIKNDENYVKILEGKYDGTKERGK